MTDLLKDYLEKHDSSGKYAKALKSAETVVGYASGVYGYYQTAMTLGEMFGLWGGKPDQFAALQDAIKELKEAIEGGFADMQRALSGEFKLERERDIAGPATTLREAIGSIRDYYLDQPENIDKAHWLQATRVALGELATEAYWARTFYEQAAYWDPWTGPVFPDGVTGTGNEQWDYLLTLPAYLEGLACRVAVVMLLDPENIPSDFEKHADTLRDTYFNIRDGIRTLPMPTFEQAKWTEKPMYGGYASDYFVGFAITASAWARARTSEGQGELYGAYNVLSTECSVSSYPVSAPWAPVTESQLHPRVDEFHWEASDDSSLQKRRDAFKAWYPDQVTARHAVRSLKHWKHVYSLAGLRTVWEVRNGLLRLIGKPTEPLPDASDAWSLRELIKTIPDEWRPQASIRAIANFLKTDHSLGAFRDA